MIKFIKEKLGITSLKQELLVVDKKTLEYYYELCELGLVVRTSIANEVKTLRKEMDELHKQLSEESK